MYVGRLKPSSVLLLRGVAWQLIESGEKPADGEPEEWKPLMLKLGDSPGSSLNQASGTSCWIELVRFLPHVQRMLSLSY